MNDRHLFTEEPRPGTTVRGKVVQKWHVTNTVPFPYGADQAYEIKVTFSDGTYEYANFVQRKRR